jgi:hypothetical protein
MPSFLLFFMTMNTLDQTKLVALKRKTHTLTNLNREILFCYYLTFSCLLSKEVGDKIQKSRHIHKIQQVLQSFLCRNLRNQREKK